MTYHDQRPTWSEWVEDACRGVEQVGRWRAPRTFDARGPSGQLAERDGTVRRPVVSFASNDYLGLTTHPAVTAAAHEALDRWGTGAGASRLVTGSRPVHSELESELASWKRTEGCVLFPTGFAANLSVLSVFATADAHVFSDELNHASIVDGCRLSRAVVTVYPHNDLGALERALRTARRRPVIVSDTVFSMDGDAADLGGIVEVAARHGALVVLDEAHAVLGPELPEVGGHSGDAATPVLRVGTLSKALGSLGGFVAGPRRFVELLENLARPYIFTTAPTPADAAAALAALGVLRSGEGAGLLARLGAHVGTVAAALGRGGHRSPIVPVMIGDEREAVEASDRLADEGLWVPAIRPPTVAPGTSRLRVTLSAAHAEQDVARLVDALGALGVLEQRNQRRPPDEQRVAS